MHVVRRFELSTFRNHLHLDEIAVVLQVERLRLAYGYLISNQLRRHIVVKQNRRGRVERLEEQLRSLHFRRNVDEVRRRLAGEWKQLNGRSEGVVLRRRDGDEVKRRGVARRATDNHLALLLAFAVRCRDVDDHIRDIVLRERHTLRRAVVHHCQSVHHDGRLFLVGYDHE